jgi:hypothetical protein
MNFDQSFFARQLKELANSGADGQAQVDRIRELLELQRLAHMPEESMSGNVVPFTGRRQILPLD